MESCFFWKLFLKKILSTSKLSVSAVQIPEEFMSLLRHIGTNYACTHAYIPMTIHDASGQCDAAEQIAADRLPDFQGKDTDGIWWSCYAMFD